MTRRLWSLSALLSRGAVHDLQPSQTLANLLDDADERERILAQGRDAGTTLVPRAAPRHAVQDAPAPAVHPSVPAGTDSFGEVFQQLLDEHERAALANAVAEERSRVSAERRPGRADDAGIDRPAPALAAGPGDLVLVFGMRGDARTVVEALAASHPGIQLAAAGAGGSAGWRHVGGRREATQARADGVRRGMGTLVAVGVGETAAAAGDYADILAEVSADQVWIAVDVTRKPEDTRLWASAVARAGAGIDAAAVLGTAETSTPGSVRLLGVPIGWSDGVVP